jgi:hypothetical protein
MKKKRRTNRGRRKFLSKLLIILVIILALTIYFLFSQLKHLELTGELANVGFVSSDDDPNTTSIIDISINKNITKEINFTHLDIRDKVPYNHLILYMPFDKNDGSKNVYDYSFENNDGILNGTPPHPDCIYDNCYLYGGEEDFIDFGDNDRFDFGDQAFTISLWIKGKAKDNLIIGKDNENKLDKGIFIYTNSEDGYPSYWNGTVQTNFGSNDTNWHHLAITRQTIQNNKVSLYYDGVEVNTTNDERTLSNSKNFRIGVTNDNKDYFNGSLDELMIFSSSLSSIEIENIYNNQSAKFEQEGTITLRQFDFINNGNNNVVVTTDDFDNLLGSSLDLRVAGWDLSDGYDSSKTSVKNKGLRGYWHADSNLNDASGNSNNGAGNGSSGFNDFGYNSGLWGKSFKFDGLNDFINITNDPNLDIINEITISVWIKQEDLSNGVILYKGLSGSDRNYQFDVLQNGRFEFCNDVTCHNTEIVLRENIWEHLIVTYNEVNKVFYHNGVLISNITTSESLSIDTGNLIIGRGPEGVLFNGSMEDLMLFNRSIGTEEVEELYIRGRANYNFEGYQLVDGSNSFSISEDSTNLLTEYKFNAAANRFYTPLLSTGIHFSFDQAGSSSVSSSSRVFVDDGIVDIVFPINSSNTYNNLLNIKYTVNYTNVSTCWYSNGTFRVNKTIPNCRNITNLIWKKGDHEVRVYANSSDGNVSSSRVFFTIQRDYSNRIIDSTSGTDFNQTPPSTDSDPITIGIGSTTDSSQGISEGLDPSIVVYYLIIAVLLIMIFIVIFLIIRATKAHGVIR